MDKTSTPDHSSTSVRSSVPHPRKETIERIRQYARASFAAPLGTMLILN